MEDIKIKPDPGALGAILRGEDKFRRLVNVLREGVWVIDKNAYTVFVNPRMEEMFGYGAGEMLGRHLFSFMDERGKKLCEKLLKRREQGVSEQHEFEFLKKNGARIYVLMETTSVKDECGSYTGGIATLTDITERKRIDEGLRDSEERLKILFEFAPDAYYINDLSGKIIDGNKAAEELTGYKREELIGKSFLKLKLIPRGQLFKVAALLAKSVLKQPTGPDEFTIQRKDKTGVQVEIRSYPVKIKNEDLMLGIARDITGRRKTEDSLRKSEERYRELWLNAPVGYHVVDGSGTIIDVNNAELKMLGYTLKEMMGRPIFDFVSPEQRSEAMERFRQKTAGKAVPSRIDRIYQKKNGSGINVYLEDMAEFGPEGKIISVRTAMVDVSERRKMEQELEKIQRLESLGIFAGGIAHDFNNLLTTILGNVSLTKMGMEKEGEDFKALLMAEGAARQAKELANQLLTFSKGGAPLKESTDIARLLKDAVTFALHGSSLKPSFWVQDGLWNADVDKGQISQVIDNIVLNSIQAMPGGGNIHVKAENKEIKDKEIKDKEIKDKEMLVLKEGGYIKITIQDEGPGIPGENIEKIFDPFFTTKKEGSGLGLTLAYSIIKKHGGHITVESSGKQGTAFIMYLPATNADAVKEEKEVLRKGAGRILIMDDEENVRNTLARLLEHLGYQVKASVDSKEAVDLYKESMRSLFPFDAVILDIVIPGGMGGREAVKELLKINRDARIIVSTGFSNDPVSSNFREFGFCASITKPYTVEELSRKLDEAIKAGK